MNASSAALAGLRIGTVPYLNARPLVFGLDPASLVAEVPARLAERFSAGELDVALLPLFEVLRSGGGRIVDGVAIACRGEVFSVVVASRGRFEEAGSIFLDPASRSSSALLKVLLAEYYPDGPRPVENGDKSDSRLLIGDAAMAFRRQHGDAWSYHDLGALWNKHTGLPFVFAVWTARPNVAIEAFAALREAKAAGVAAISRIASGCDDPGFVRTYLSGHISYELGLDEKISIRQFEALARRHGFIQRLDPAQIEFL